MPRLPAKSVPTRRAGPGIRFSTIGVGILALVVLFPFGALLFESVRNGTGFGVGAWKALLEDPRMFAAIQNTATLSAARVGISFILGAGIAWLLARTTLPERRWLELGFWASLFMPTLTVTLGWVLLFDGSRGFGQMLPVGDLFNVFSWWGIVFTHLTSGTLAFAVVLLVPVFRRMDGAMEDASDALGGRRFHRVVRVAVPAMLPALAAVTVLSIIRSVDTLEVEWVLGAREGISVLGTLLYADVLDGGSRFTGSAALSSLFLALVTPLVLMHRSMLVEVSMAGESPRPTNLGKWTSPAFYLVALVLATLTIIPLSLVAFASFGPFTAEGWSTSAWQSAFTGVAMMSALQTSFAVAVGASFLAIALFSAIGYFVTRMEPGERGPLDLLTSLPGSVPSVIIAMGILIAIVQVPVMRDVFYGKVAVLVLVALLTTLPAGVHVMRSALLTLGTEAVDASRAAGASLAYTLRHVLLPLVAPAMLLIGMLTFALAIRLTGPVAILATDSMKPLTILQLELVRSGADPLAAVIGVVLSVTAVGVAVGARLISIGGVSSLENPPE